jgi:hypothetical protein
MNAPPPAPDPALAAGLDLPVVSEARTLAAAVAETFGPGTAALLHYGSRAQGSGAEPDSAWDFVVMVDDPAASYRALAKSGASTLSPTLARMLHRVLPPTVVASRPPSLPGQLAKCVVLSEGELVRGCSPQAKDHFLLGRLFQDVRRVWTRDVAAGAAIAHAVASARACTIDWVRPYLPASFTATEYLRTLLRVSYAGEVRPETAGRVDTLTAAQSATLLPILGGMLDHLAARGELARDGDAYRDLHPPGPAERARRNRYFLRSKMRITMRWPKHVLLYDGWLDYVVRKVERRSGVRMTLTPLERRWPLVFLWPRAVRYFLTRPRTGGA